MPTHDFRKQRARTAAHDERSAADGNHFLEQTSRKWCPYAGMKNGDSLASVLKVAHALGTSIDFSCSDGSINAGLDSSNSSSGPDPA
jgi:hypothetical protein